MSKVVEHFCQILACLTISTHQMCSCQVTHVANFENFYVWPNSAFIFRKSHNIFNGKVLYFRRNEPKTSRGVEPLSPSAFRVNQYV